MSGVKTAVEQLAKLAESLEGEYDQMMDATSRAVEAAAEADFDAIEEALAKRKKTMDRIEQLVLRQEELAGKTRGSSISSQVVDELKQVRESQINRLRQIAELDGKLTEALAALKERTTEELKLVSKLKQTAKGYRPKDDLSEALFIDHKR